MNHNNTEINNNELQIGFIAELQLRHSRDVHIMRKNSGARGGEKEEERLRRERKR